MLELVGRGPGVIEQRTLARVIAEGLFDRHLRRLRRRRAERQAVLLDTIADAAPNLLAASPAPAGRHLVVRIVRPGANATDVAARARAHGLRVTPLSARRIGPGPDDALLIGYAGIGPDRLREGIRRLAAIVATAPAAPFELSRAWPGAVGLPASRLAARQAVRAKP
jgi:GntR family transcriptional regulator/MocR family aminotransferase